MLRIPVMEIARIVTKLLPAIGPMTWFLQTCAGQLAPDPSDGDHEHSDVVPVMGLHVLTLRAWLLPNLSDGDRERGDVLPAMGT